MNHLTEKQLMLYYYREARDRSVIDSHLATCDSCRKNYEDLQDVLEAVNAPPVPKRMESYDVEVWRRIRPLLEERRGIDWMVFFQPRRLAALSALATLLAITFLVGRFWSKREERQAQPISANARDRILLIAVGDHLDRSQMVLLELVNARSDGIVDITSEQQRAEDLVASNRLYRQTAARTGDVGVASVLDELERILLEIARSPSKLNATELEEIQQRIESHGILFKVRVIDSQVRAKERESLHESARGKI